MFEVTLVSDEILSTVRLYFKINLGTNICYVQEVRILKICCSKLIVTKLLPKSVFEAFFSKTPGPQNKLAKMETLLLNQLLSNCTVDSIPLSSVILYGRDHNLHFKLQCCAMCYCMRKV